MALSDNAKTLALASPGVRALTREQYFEKAKIIQDLALEFNLPDTKEAHDFCDLAFAGLLWSEGRLQEVPVEVGVESEVINGVQTSAE
jgi:hypothetical protein